jgi:hypothetical protein
MAQVVEHLLCKALSSNSDLTNRKKKKKKKERKCFLGSVVTHAYNLSYSGGKDQED